MKSKKSRFWTFWFSLLPGCAEMYMGFMKMGLSLMLIFWGIIAIASFLSIGPVVLLAAIVWFYGFFHAHNLAAAPDEVFNETEDQYLFNLEGVFEGGNGMVKKYRKVISIVMILLGVVLCFRGVMDMLMHILPEYFRGIYNMMSWYLPQIIVGVGIIVLGVYMIRGKKKELENVADSKETKLQEVTKDGE